MVWSGGCDGVITPHATCVRPQPQDRAGVAVPHRPSATAMSAELLPEDIGRPRHGGEGRRSRDGRDARRRDF